MRILLFVLYVWAISFMKDIKRVFQYHGAEHKTIHCFENGLELTAGKLQTVSNSPSEMRHQLSDVRVHHSVCAAFPAGMAESGAEDRFETAAAAGDSRAFV